MRKYKLLTLLDEAGNITFNHGGKGFDWNPRFKNQQVRGNSGESRRVWQRQNLWQTAELQYRGYDVTDFITDKELEENKGPEARIEIATGMEKRLRESLMEYLARQPYVDGSAAGNELYWHGLESFLATNGTIKYDDGTQRTANAADIFGYPSDTYAGLTTGLGDYGGSAPTSGVWPQGIVDPEYDFWSPIIINYTSTALTGGATWKLNCVEALREGLHQCKRNDSKDDGVDLVIVDRRMWVDFLNRQDTKERTIVSESTRLRNFGFMDVVSFDGGVEITTEYGCPANVGYFLNTAKIYLRSMYKKLVQPDPEMPKWNEDYQQYRYALKTLSNMKFESPRNYGKLVALA